MTTSCLICGTTPKRLHSDHCHRHDRQRGRICPRCNALMRWIDAGKPPQVPAQELQNLTEHAARCPDCVAGKPGSASTCQLNIGIPDDLAADLKSYAATYGIPIAAAVRVLLYKALQGKAQGTIPAVPMNRLYGLLLAHDPHLNYRVRRAVVVRLEAD